LSAFVERVEAGRSFGGSAPSARADEWGIVKVSAMTWGAFRPSENKAVPTVAVDPRFEIKPGDLLVSRANTTAYVGAAVLVGETRPKLLLSDKSLRIVARPGIDPRWLLAALTSPRARTQISALATGTKDSMRNISQANLLGVRLPDEGADGRSRVVQDREQSADRGARLAAEWQEFTATPTPVLVQRDPRLYLIARTIHQRTNQALEFLLQNGLPVQVLKIAFYLDEGGRRFLDVEWDSEPESSGPVPGSATTVLVLDDPEAVAEPRDFREVTLSEVAAVVPTPATLVWLRPRKNIRYEATLLDNGVIRLPSGVEHRSPSGAAMAVADVVSYDGWYAWRVGDHGPTLNELRMEVAAGASPSAQPTAT